MKNCLHGKVFRFDIIVMLRSHHSAVTLLCASVLQSERIWYSVVVTCHMVRIICHGLKGQKIKDFHFSPVKSECVVSFVNLAKPF